MSRGRNLDLFAGGWAEKKEMNLPLAARMRPRSLDEIVGQARVIGDGAFLRKAIESDEVPSLILYGPPGSGKTTLARILSETTQAHFEPVNATASGVAELRRLIDQAEDRLRIQGQRTILFVDEIHRFNKAQQDALLPAVEDGTVTLIGATTENPYFTVNAPLLSRARIVRLDPLGEEEILGLLRRALADEERGLGRSGAQVDEDALRHMAQIANGDARSALNTLEAAVKLAGQGRVDLKAAEEAAGQRALQYDRDGDNHYDTVSAWIKSMRGSDPDAAIYWLARMIHAGEDPRFIARRLVVHAAEDVGNADPRALQVAVAAAEAVQLVGMPEARIPLAQAVLYIACAPKSNAAYLAIDEALEDVRRRAQPPVPKHLRDSSYPGSKELGHGEGYHYPHNEPGGFVKQAYRPEGERRRYYLPKDIGEEARLKERLEKLWGLADAAGGGEGDKAAD